MLVAPRKAGLASFGHLALCHLAICFSPHPSVQLCVLCGEKDPRPTNRGRTHAAGANSAHAAPDATNPTVHDKSRVHTLETPIGAGFARCGGACNVRLCPFSI